MPELVLIHRLPLESFIEAFAEMYVGALNIKVLSLRGS